MSTRKYACHKCDGEGVTSCDCCGGECECEACDGTGLDPSAVDVEAWRTAEREFSRRHGTSWDWEVDDKTVGRAAPGDATLAYDDFLTAPGG